MKLTYTETKPPKTSKPLKCKSHFLLNYLQKAPVTLALERSLECEIFARQEFLSPVMDYGCGDGLLVSILFDGGVNYGADISRRELKIAAKNGIYEKIFDSARTDMPVKPGSINTVLCNSAAEHMEDLDGSLAQIYNLMSEEGKLYVTVPSEQYSKHTVIFNLLTWFGLHTLAQKSRKGFNIFWKHIQCFSQELWIKKFSDAGFKIISVERYAPKAVCLMGNACTPLALPAFFTKRLFGRWIMFELVRRAHVKGMHKIIKKFLSQTKGEGALIFFTLQKNHA